MGHQEDNDGPFQHVRVSNSMYFKAIGRLAVFVTATLFCTGCGLSHAWWNSWLDPTEVGNFRENVVFDIQRSISFRDTPLGIVGAEDPRPGDLVAQIQEYEIGPGDTLQVRMLDFIALGIETELTPTVDEIGYIDIPQLGRIRAEGRTARELRDDIIQMATAQGLYRPEEEPVVTVVVVNPLQRMYNLSGTGLLYPGPYRIPRPDFRLREAINQGGGLDDTIKTVYVFRNPPRYKQILERPSAPEAPPAVQPAPPPPPVSPVLMSDLQNPGGSPGSGGAPPAPPAAPVQTQEPAGTELALPADEVPEDLIEAVAPPPAAPPAPPAGAVPPPPPPDRPAAPSPDTGTPGTPDPGTNGRLPSYRFVNDGFIETPPADEAAATPARPSEPALPLAAPDEMVDWEELANELQQRIIRIPADKLRNGDPAYDIVVQNEDWIRIDPGPVGVYYMAGHVMRPGPYAFAGEQITLTQALAAAGGLDPLAWPTRCEVRRRLDGDREEITQWDLARIMDGKDPDFYLKPNDVIRVGTHAVAPLLATIRNSFRFTYGFGFVYDRNFADIDSYNAQQNPRDVRRALRQQRFGNLFN